MPTTDRLGTVRPQRQPPATQPASPGHADAEARRSVLTALLCATLVTVELEGGSAIDSVHVSSQVVLMSPHAPGPV